MFIPVIDAVPNEFEVCVSDGDFYVLTALAQSDDGVRRVGVQTALLPFVEEGAQFHEFQFSIAVTSDDHGEAFETCERDMAKGYLPDSVRPLVMPCVCGATKALIDAVHPSLIYRVTKATRPPEKALSKHELITDTLVGLGYEVKQTGTDSVGRPFWVMSR